MEQPKPEGRRYRDTSAEAKPSNGRRCPGSAQRIAIDITAEQWAERLLAAEGTATSRRTTSPVRKPRPQNLPAIVQMNFAARGPREQLVEHLQDHCSQCRLGHCATVMELRRLISRIAQAEVPPLYGQLRTALRQHRASCSPCAAGTPCTAGRQLAARTSGLAQQGMRGRRPDLYRTTRNVPTVHLTRQGFVVRTAHAASDRRDADRG
ncbi:hypothetical protein [Streptomyces melanogenes]|uniref:hypothetical protein n=1 Tax=Streptomyces melanogenes TaxID=67326 RepID=UPI00167DA9AA|nr:hypothetical protein [Streptomyces melanogenes]